MIPPPSTPKGLQHTRPHNDSPAAGSTRKCVVGAAKHTGTVRTRGSMVRTLPVRGRKSRLGRVHTLVGQAKYTGPGNKPAKWQQKTQPSTAAIEASTKNSKRAATKPAVEVPPPPSVAPELQTAAAKIQTPPIPADAAEGYFCGCYFSLHSMAMSLYPALHV
jgi:hypothetical protein